MTGSGTHRIVSEGVEAVISEHGATLLDARFDGRRVIDGPARAEPALGHHGAVLAPWPNRTAGGEYRFDGRLHRLPCNDQQYGHAIHGFVFDETWEVTDREAARVVLRRTVDHPPGYPFRLLLELAYSVGRDGVRCDARWTNAGDQIAPFGLGFHPYLRPGPSPLDEWMLSVPAGEVMDSDPTTKLPRTARRSSEEDFGTPMQIRDRRFSRCYGALARTDGIATVRVQDHSGVYVALRMSESFRWVQVFTGDVPDPRWKRRAVAVEPQTCPPNALVSGTDLLRLVPGESGTAYWALTAGHEDQNPTPPVEV
jgi:aldose 1-epimerase